MFLVGLLLNVGRRPLFAPRVRTREIANQPRRRRQRVRVVCAS